MSSYTIFFEKAANGKTVDFMRPVPVDLEMIEHVRWLTGKQLFNLVGADVMVDLPVKEIAGRFKQAGIGIYVLTDHEKDAPVIVPVENVRKMDRWNGTTSLHLKNAVRGVAELLIRESPADIKPWQGATPPVL